MAVEVYKFTMPLETLGATLVAKPLQVCVSYID